MKVGIITHSLEAGRKALENGSEFDAFELRIDTFINDPVETIDALRKETDKPLIYTLRSKTHGGKYSGDPYFLLTLAAMHPEYLDVECDVPDDIYNQLPSDIHIISSYHNFEETPKDLEAVLKRVQLRGAERYKIACMPHSANDVLRLLQLAQTRPALTVIAMGKEGSFSRVLSPIFSDMLQFIAVHEHSAPGQFTLQELLTIYRYNHLSQRTRVYALLGDPVEKSMSHATHNQVFRILKLDAVYVKIRVKKDELAEFLHRAKQLPFYGFSLTMPLKRHFSFDPINTLRREKDHWHTRNTDGVGALNAIERKGHVRGKEVLILGAGGAAHAIAAEALQRGAKVKIANRTLEKGHAIAEALGDGCVAGSLQDQTFCTSYDILVQCTPIGMYEAKIPVPSRWVLPGTTVLDSISNPKITPLLKQAEKMDCHIISGIEMFILQAVEQFLFWFPELKSERVGIERIIRESL